MSQQANMSSTRAVFGLALCLTLPGVESVPPTSAASPLPVSQPLHAIGSGGLKAAYALEVVEVPEPPGGILGEAQADAMAEGTAGGARTESSNRAERDRQARCPLEVRAIVAGESSDTTFSIVATPAESALVSVGETVRVGDTKLVVDAIEAESVVLRRKGETFHCSLGADGEGR